MVGRKIGEGATADIFEWLDGGAGARVLKLAKSPRYRQAIREEYDRHRLVWSLGLPVPRPVDVVEVDGRTGMVLERVNGKSVLERLAEEAAANGSDGRLSRALGDFRLLARVLAQIHGQTTDRLRSQRDYIRARLERTGDLTADEKARIWAIVDALPEKSRLCHGDPHPGNLLVGDGQPAMIDWMDVTLGSPEADVADLVVLVRYSPLPPSLPEEAVKRINAMREPLVQEFLDEYRRITGIDLEAVDAWIVPMAARRLTMGILTPEAKQVLLAQIRQRLG